ncbi:hypothetical protein EA58_14710 [Photobacterium galatheae]|uniref:Uncharacterized protein n=1 Tax=Photobacterium galatheae TaxID=1654360 RepID=A0A066RKX5_9GAMM|nr:hypothetical protein EA58_14710 [Photobacterium galatheae]
MKHQPKSLFCKKSLATAIPCGSIVTNAGHFTHLEMTLQLANEVLWKGNERSSGLPRSFKLPKTRHPVILMIVKLVSEYEEVSISSTQTKWQYKDNNRR